MRLITPLRCAALPSCRGSPRQLAQLLCWRLSHPKWTSARESGLRCTDLRYLLPTLIFWCHLFVFCWCIHDVIMSIQHVLKTTNSLVFPYCYFCVAIEIIGWNVRSLPTHTCGRCMSLGTKNKRWPDSAKPAWWLQMYHITQHSW